MAHRSLQCCDLIMDQVDLSLEDLPLGVASIQSQSQAIDGGSLNADGFPLIGKRGVQLTKLQGGFGVTGLQSLVHGVEKAVHLPLILAELPLHSISLGRVSAHPNQEGNS
jgi:hypothetical protein